MQIFYELRQRENIKLFILKKNPVICNVIAPNALGPRSIHFIKPINIMQNTVKSIQTLNIDCYKSVSVYTWRINKTNMLRVPNKKTLT